MQQLVLVKQHVFTGSDAHFAGGMHVFDCLARKSASTGFCVHLCSVAKANVVFQQVALRGLLSSLTRLDPGAVSWVDSSVHYTTVLSAGTDSYERLLSSVVSAITKHDGASSITVILDADELQAITIPRHAQPQQPRPQQDLSTISPSLDARQQDLDPKTISFMEALLNQLPVAPACQDANAKTTTATHPSNSNSNRDSTTNSQATTNSSSTNISYSSSSSTTATNPESSSSITSTLKSSTMGSTTAHPTSSPSCYALVQNIYHLPFGPCGTSPPTTSLLRAWRQLQGVICISHFVAAYLQQHAEPYDMPWLKSPNGLIVLTPAAVGAFGGPAWGDFRGLHVQQLYGAVGGGGKAGEGECVQAGAAEVELAAAAAATKQEAREAGFTTTGGSDREAASAAAGEDRAKLRAVAESTLVAAAPEAAAAAPQASLVPEGGLAAGASSAGGGSLAEAHGAMSGAAPAAGAGANSARGGFMVAAEEGGAKPGGAVPEGAAAGDASSRGIAAAADEAQPGAAVAGAGGISSEGLGGGTAAEAHCRAQPAAAAATEDAASCHASDTALTNPPPPAAAAAAHTGLSLQGSGFRPSGGALVGVPVIGMLKLTPEKGAALFLALARRLPQYKFVAVTAIAPDELLQRLRRLYTAAGDGGGGAAAGGDDAAVVSGGGAAGAGDWQRGGNQQHRLQQQEEQGVCEIGSQKLTKQQHHEQGQRQQQQQQEQRQQEQQLQQQQELYTDIPSNVTLLPPTADLDSLLQQLHLVLVPSVLHEAFGMVVVDAMLRGVPVLVNADSGALLEASRGMGGCSSGGKGGIQGRCSKCMGGCSRGGEGGIRGGCSSGFDVGGCSRGRGMRAGCSSSFESNGGCLEHGEAVVRECSRGGGKGARAGCSNVVDLLPGGDRVVVGECSSSSSSGRAGWRCAVTADGSGANTGSKSGMSDPMEMTDISCCKGLSANRVSAEGGGVGKMGSKKQQFSEVPRSLHVPMVEFQEFEQVDDEDAPEGAVWRRSWEKRVYPELGEANVGRWVEEIRRVVEEGEVVFSRMCDESLRTAREYVMSGDQEWEDFCKWLRVT